MISGDSSLTVPTFHHFHPDYKCDFIFIDGDHIYDMALADIRNMARLAQEGAWVAVDDIGFFDGVDEAVVKAVEEGVINVTSHRVHMGECYEHVWIRDGYWHRMGLPIPRNGLMVGQYATTGPTPASSLLMH